MGSMGKLPMKFYIVTFVMAFAFILGTQVLKEHVHSYKIKYEKYILHAYNSFDCCSIW